VIISSHYTEVKERFYLLLESKKGRIVRLSGCSAAWFNASALGAEDRGFESRHPDHEIRKHRHGGAFSLIIRVFDKLGGGVEGRMVAF
jgi:hypothetical protein